MHRTPPGPSGISLPRDAGPGCPRRLVRASDRESRRRRPPRGLPTQLLGSCNRPRLHWRFCSLSLQYDPSLSLLHILVSAADAGAALFCACFEEPPPLSPALRGSVWFTQTGAEFYTPGLLSPVSESTFRTTSRIRASPQNELQVRAVCMCGASAVVAIPVSYETGQCLDIPALLIIPELLSCLSFSTMGLDSPGC